MDSMTFFGSLYARSLALDVKCHRLSGSAALCGCRRQGARSLMWNSLRETDFISWNEEF